MTKDLKLYLLITGTTLSNSFLLDEYNCIQDIIETRINYYKNTLKHCGTIKNIEIISGEDEKNTINNKIVCPITTFKLENMNINSKRIQEKNMLNHLKNVLLSEPNSFGEVLIISNNPRKDAQYLPHLCHNYEINCEVVSYLTKVIEEKDKDIEEIISCCDSCKKPLPVLGNSIWYTVIDIEQVKDKKFCNRNCLYDYLLKEFV